ncbi:glycosyltransferase family 4 protein [Sanguibacter sp. HDW7]|uniref:glycosyltransferase family 4 protein n=1 Tax=Sanguibacter sp. HDW7 TaxID=2714931 RepID=UPI00140B8124|nr:glycosyltransferase family 4 protein [Sanguibacter sp. HDW7]QIK82844.1 glycosyltransferase family 4 protein [Sanguibacter sp. HDW7]
MPTSPATSGPRALHVNDVAGVATTLVTTARARGLAWNLRRIPAGRGAPAPVVAARRALDLVRAVRPLARTDVAHLHYGVTGYYGWVTRRPVVLHLHGTDVRVDARSRWLGPVVRAAVRRADLVLVATPDLLDLARELRDDAVYLPNPVPDALFAPAAGTPDPAGAHRGTRVVLNMRWDDAKGGMSLVAAARTLAADGLDVVGLDWGAYATDARAAGVRLVPLQDAAGFRALLAGADLVVGQQRAGALGISDLEALALGRPLVAHVRGDEPVVRSDEGSLVDVVRATLAAGPDDSPAARAARTAWVRERHGADGVLDRLLALYATL